MKSRWLGTCLVVLGALTSCTDDSGLDSPRGVREATASASSVPSPAHSRSCATSCYGKIAIVGTLSSDVVTEPSGMAASIRNPGSYYVVSDVPGTSSVTAIRENGTVVATLEVDGMAAQNAEALAVGPCGDETETASCLYVGDIGDHVGRDTVIVYQVPEPDLTEVSSETVPATQLVYTYPDAPTDAEALLVDALARPIIISKATFESGVTGPTAMYRGPAGGGSLEHLGELAVPEPPRPLFAQLAGNVITGASARDGRVLLRTYDDVIEYVAPAGEAELATFPSWPHTSVPAAAQVQSETVAYRSGGCGYLTTSELSGSIASVRCVTG